MIEPQPESTFAAPEPGKSKIDHIGLLLRTGTFILAGWTTLIVAPYFMIFALGSRDLIFVISALSSFAAGAVANAFTARVFEHGRLSDFGLAWTLGWSPLEGTSDGSGSPRGSSSRAWLTGTALGIAAAFALVAIPVVAEEASFGRAPASTGRTWITLLLVSVVLLFGAAGEEMLFHGYAFQVLARTLGPFATILPAGVLFGLAHLGNPNATFLGILNTILWGILLGCAFVRTGALWLPIGMHFGWNLALALSGSNLSGFTIGLTGYALQWRAGDLWSGGPYGPEGSLVTTVIVVALFYAVVRVTPERDPLSSDAG